jgi:hypothetical protein
MPKIGYTVGRLEGLHWKPLPVACDTLHEAIAMTESHLTENAPEGGLIAAALQQHGELNRRVYKTEEPPWFPTIVEYGPNPQSPMTTLAMYKIVMGQPPDPG